VDRHETEEQQRKGEVFKNAPRLVANYGVKFLRAWEYYLSCGAAAALPIPAARNVSVHADGNRYLGPGLPRGSELSWTFMGNGPDPYSVAVDQLKYVVFRDANWDWRTFDLTRDGERYWAPENLPMNATDPNMKPFFAHNGKLLMYQGFADANVSPLQTIAYYQNVVDNLGGPANASSNFRLFFAPGMGHCGGGDGPNEFDKINALDRWVEINEAPQTLIASQRVDGKVTRTRPLCQFPQIAVYKGSGSVDDAANFTCRAQ
jgi:feruloyl esterase